MKLMSREYDGRLKRCQRPPQQGFYVPVQPIAFGGFAWGHTWEYMWVRAKAVIPEECAGR